MIGDKSQKNRGFTLIEIIVALAVFSLVLTSVLGIFFLSLKAQRVAIINKAVSEDVRFSLEFMSRSMRLAHRFDSEVGQPVGCLSDGVTFSSTTSSDIQHINTNNRCVRFSLSGNSIRYYSDFINNPTQFVGLTNINNSKIDSLEFIILGASELDSEQPRVTMVIEASGAGSAPEAAGVQINMQTSVSQRNLDVP